MKTRLLIASDSFKGTLSSREICNIWKNLIDSKFKDDFDVSFCCLADGGEGTLEAIEETKNFRRITTETTNPIGEKIKASYLLNKDGDNAIIELAQASGLTLIENRLDALNSSTYGTGLLIKDALNKGVKKIKVFLGGSATTDGGTGIMYALGCKFFDKNKKEIMPVGGTLIKIKSVDFDALRNISKDVSFECFSDVRNPLYGKHGAAYIFAKQKGALNKEIETLDKGLRNLSNVIKRTYNKDISRKVGLGSAGGSGIPFILNGASIRSGIAEIFKIINFKKKVDKCDYIITGEGCFDNQSLNGKTISGIINLPNKNTRKIIIVCGSSKLTNSKIKIYETGTNRKTFNEIKINAKLDYLLTAEKVLLDLKLTNNNVL